MEREPLGVLGAGWVGLVTAACFADLGHSVVVRDILPERVADLEAGRVPIYEPGLSDLLAANRERIRYTLALDEVFSAARIVFICVGTPPTYSGDADLSAVWSILEELPEVDERAVLVMKSTVPVGTGAKVRRELDVRGHGNVGYVSNPEFLAESTAVRDFTNPDRIVIGAFDPSDGDAVETLYEPLAAPVVRMDVGSAEMVKLASNAFLATKISFINEIANVCEETGADVAKVAEGMGLDRRIGPLFLRPGIGYSGSCLPKDVTALKQLAGNSGYHFQLLTAVIEVNELQKRRIVGKLSKHLGPLAGKTIALLGLTFKPDTNDMRDAPSLVLGPRLLAEGAYVRAWDPVVGDEARVLLRGVELAPTMLAAIEDADAAVIVTEWEVLAELVSEEARSAMRNPLIVDGRNMLDPEAVRAAGFAYEAIGRASSVLEGLPETAEPERELRS
jgi:UDPglucose 6-dehydrogenase